MSFKEKLAHVNALLREVRKEIENGATLSTAEARALIKMSETARDMRDYAIAHDPSSVADAGKRWNLSGPRISQIRTQAKTGITIHRQRMDRNRLN